MKINHLLFLVVAFLFVGTSTVNAQKLKDKKTAFKYVRLPLKQLPDDHLTYSVNVYGNAIGAADMSASGLADRIKMNGFKRLSGQGNDFGHIRISVYTGYAYISSGELKSKKKVKKDKETGKETTTYSYWYEFPCNGTASYKFVDPKGNILFTKEVPQRVTKKTSNYSSSSAARKAYTSQKNSMQKSFARELCNAVVSSAEAQLSSHYDYAHQNRSQQLYIIKKHSTEAQFAKFQEQINKLFTEVSADTPTADLKSSLADAMAFYEKIAQKEAKGDKKLLRIQKAGTYNLAVLAYYVDELDRAEALANKVMKLDGGKDKRSKDLIAQITKTRERMAANNIMTMRFQRDLSAAKAPSQIAAFEEIKEEIKEENNTIQGSIVVGDQALTGNIIQSKESDQMSFGPDGNTKFIVEKDGKLEEYDLAKSDISSFKIGERQFQKMNFKPCAKGKGETAVHILEEVYTSDKINLYKYYPSTGSLGNEATEFAFKKANDAAPISLLDTQFLILKKGLANYFSDCSDLSEMATEGTFELKEDSLIKAARIYSELCE